MKDGYPSRCERISGRHSRYFILVVCPKCQQERWTRADYRKAAKHFPHCAKCAPHSMMMENNPAWTGGRIIHKGYILVKVPHKDPLYCMTNRHGYIPEHRLVMAKHLGRPLLRREIVHHIDGDRQNNSLSNLEIVNNTTHNTRYRRGYELGYKRGYKDGTRAANGTSKEV